MKRPTSRILLAVAAAALVVPFAASCMDSGDEGHRAGDPGTLLEPTQPPEVEAQQLAATPKGKLLPLRDGEQRMTLTMPETYTPSAPMRRPAPTTTAASCSTRSSTRTSG